MIDLEEKKRIEDFLESKGFRFSHTEDGWKQCWYGSEGTDSEPWDVMFDPKEKDLELFGRKERLSFQHEESRFFLNGETVTTEKLRLMFADLEE